MVNQTCSDHSPIACAKSWSHAMVEKGFLPRIYLFNDASFSETPFETFNRSRAWHCHTVRMRICLALVKYRNCLQACYYLLPVLLALLQPSPRCLQSIFTGQNSVFKRASDFPGQNCFFPAFDLFSLLKLLELDYFAGHVSKVPSKAFSPGKTLL